MRELASLILTAGILTGLTIFVTRASAVLARRVWTIVFAIVLGSGVTMMTTHAFVAKWGFRGDDPRDGLLRLMDGTGSRPFVYRRLAPDIVRLATDGLLSKLPPKAVNYLLERSPLRHYRVDWIGVESWTPRKALAFHIAYILVWLARFGTLLAAAFLLKAMRKSSWIECIATASLAMCLVPLTSVGGGYIYDATELLLWTVLILSAVRGWLLAVPFLFALMLVNKESALIAVPALIPLLSRRTGLRNALLWAAGLGLMGCLWLCFVRERYAALPGTPRELWLATNLAFWSRPESYFMFSQTFSPTLPAPRGGNLLLLLLFLLPMRFGWEHLRSDCKWATALTALLLVPLFLVSGHLDEIRALSLLFPFLYLISVEGIHELLRTEALS